VKIRSVIVRALFWINNRKNYSPLPITRVCPVSLYRPIILLCSLFSVLHGLMISRNSSSDVSTRATLDSRGHFPV